MKENTGKYDDIINLPRPVSKKHPPMPMANRAAQFSPFAALSGHNEAIREAARETEKRRTLGENEQEILNRKIALLRKHLAEQPEITATYFEPDGKKDGGRYVSISGRIRKIDNYQRLLLLEGGVEIPFEDLAELSGELFESSLFDG